jgi:hypothetical protein
LRLSEAFCEFHKECKLHTKHEPKKEKIIKEFDKLNTDDFCAWLLHYHIDMFKRFHQKYLNDACLTPEEKKELTIDFDMIKNEVKKTSKFM